MRLLHTSDWHLGRSFHRVGLLDAQAAFIDSLVAAAVEESVDVVVVSGDIYDRALPPVDAVALAGSALQRLLSCGVRVVMTSGNHDSAPRLGFAAGLIDAAGIHLRTDPGGVGSPVVIPDAHGDVAIYGLPYLEPDLVCPVWQVDPRSHQGVLDEAMRRVRTDLAARAAGTRSVVLSHAFVTGAARSESERDISVGGVQSVARETFDGVDYAALGHLHGRHTLSPGVRYSGSPIAYSFSEQHHVKGSWLVDLGPRGFQRAEFLPAPVPRRLASIRGTVESLLKDATHAAAEQAWVHATITDPRRPRAALDQLQRRFPHLLMLTFEPFAGDAPQPATTSLTATTRSDAQVIADFYAEMAGRPLDADETALVQLACDACRISEAAAS